MKIDIILAGVGGQGILSIANIIGHAALKKGLKLKQAEVHGMSQRGGDVQSHLRLADYEIASDLIPKGQADLIISVEPMESLRYLPWLSSTGWLITNDNPFVNIPNYPEREAVDQEFAKLPHKIVIAADHIAKELGSARSANMVVLGAYLKAKPVVHMESIRKGLEKSLPERHHKLIPMNLEAMKAGGDHLELVTKSL